ncbi:MAG: DUF5615 family PIN-like protein [Pirellulales bacterium]|nr:DUF5615 family PIN-like protein [Pirellulales bacterium]
MKLLLDQGLPRSTVHHLADIGVAAEHVGDLGLARATDAQILDVARERGSAVVTLDADFHALLATSRAAGPDSFAIGPPAVALADERAIEYPPEHCLTRPT